jgi:hypothetical protein
MPRINLSWRALITAVLLIVVAVTASWRWRSSQQAAFDRLRPSGDEATTSGLSQFTLPEASHSAIVDQQLAKLDPQQDNWESEVISARIAEQLGQLSKAIENGFAQGGTEKGVPDILDDGFRGQTVIGSSLETIVDEPLCRVERLPAGDAVRGSTASLPETVASWQKHTQGDAPRCSFKIVDIRLEDHGATTRVLAELMRPLGGPLGDTVQQTNVVCECHWRLPADGAAPRLRALTIDSYELVSLSGGGRPLFEEATRTVLGKTEGYLDQVCRDTGHWSERLTGLDDMRIYGHHGVAVGDVNNDGLEDLYVCDSGGLPNRLYLQQADGTVIDGSAGSGVNWLESSTAALLIDLDNDGDQDLVVATVAALLFAANDGQGRFQIRAVQPGLPEAHSLCSADYDNDGDLDLYVCNYGSGGEPGGRRGFEGALPIPYHDANNGGRNILLENQGNWEFADVTSQRGLDDHNHRWSFAAAWEDFDGDGDIDLYVANDFGRNNLYRNQNGRFQDVAGDVDVEDMAAGMSVSWGDANRDGRMDLYVGNMFSAAGNRVTFQRRFLTGRSTTISAGVQRMARGNTLFTAQSDGTFRDDSLSAEVTMGRWAWSSKFVDLNNDGWEDLFVANGYFTNHKPDDL